MLVLEHGPPALVGCEVQALSIADEEPPGLRLLVGDGVDRKTEWGVFPSVIFREFPSRLVTNFIFLIVIVL